MPENTKTNPPDLSELLKRAREHIMSPEEYEAQRQSWSRPLRLSKEEARRQLDYVNGKIAGATGWGAALTELDEWRRDLERILEQP